jgi:DNA-binding NtrC family response regulator
MGGTKGQNRKSLQYRSIKSTVKAAAASIFVVDDDPDIREVIKDRLASLGYEVSTASSGKECLSFLEKRNPQLILLDIEMPEMSGLEVLREIRKREINVSVLMISAYGTIERAVEAIREGAYDFVPKPFEPSHLAVIIQRALERDSLKKEVEILSEEASDRYRLIAGTNSGMNPQLDAAKKAAGSSATVLLLGESGTGKELFARAIHNWSNRKGKPFIAINCVGLSKDLLESELFGHEKGAFTGAHQQKKGKMELANGGTVFLDEVGDISTELQTKLLRFLQEREFERIGGTQTVHVDVRVIAATSRDLDEAVREGRFRKDLYYRLDVVPIVLPPLRERKEDIASLANYFMQRFSREAKKNFTEISQQAIDQLLGYDWPGNVRELANVIERSIVLGTGPTITPTDLPPRIALGGTNPTSQELQLPYHQAIDAFRRNLVEKALADYKGSRVAAAKALGIQRTYLSRLIKTLHIR